MDLGSINHYTMPRAAGQAEIRRFTYPRCGFVNDVLHIREREKSLFRGEPVKRSHGKVVIESVPNSKLPAEIFEG
ncbi:MAG: hypothetical protein K6F67_01080, partial [Oscillospiraceae bacterium]|nr:hypothetical protein [Oscillospiraceae bacterium]